MIRTFTIPDAIRDEVEKKLRRVERKASRLGASVSFTFGETYVKAIPVLEKDPDTHQYMQVSEAMYTVFDLTIDAGLVRKDGYTVDARLEHAKEGNFVTVFGDAEKKVEWYNLPARCEHCGRNHSQKITYIVSKDGKSRQVGRTCLKEYTGIDPMAIGIANEILELLAEDDVREYDFSTRPATRAYSTLDVLAVACRILRDQGYVKADYDGSNRSELFRTINEKVSDADVETARKILEYYRAMDRDVAARDLILEDWMILQSEYVTGRHFGRLAWLPRAWEIRMEREAKAAALEAQKAQEREGSRYVGTVGQRIEVSLTEIKLLTSYETEWGITRIYKLTDDQGNTLIWKASGAVDTSAKRIKGTVKEHSEYDGVKQTILTRCKAV